MLRSQDGQQYVFFGGAQIKMLWSNIRPRDQNHPVKEWTLLENVMETINFGLNIFHIFLVSTLKTVSTADRRLSFTTAGSLYRAEILRHTVKIALLVFTSLYLRDKNVQLKFFTLTEGGVLLVKVRCMWPPVKNELMSLRWSKFLASVRRLLLLFGAM